MGFFNSFAQGLADGAQEWYYNQNPYLYANWSGGLPPTMMQQQPPSVEPSQEQSATPTGMYGTIAGTDGTTDWKATVEANPTMTPREYARQARQSNWRAMRANKQLYSNAYHAGQINFNQMYEGRKNTFNQMKAANQNTRIWRDENQNDFLKTQQTYQKGNYNAMSGGVGMYAYQKNGGFINYSKIFNLW